jgi:hypothetical protein
MTNHPTSADEIDPLALYWIHYLQHIPPGGDICVEVRLVDLLQVIDDQNTQGKVREIMGKVHECTEREYRRRERRKIEDDSKPNCLHYLCMIFDKLGKEEGITVLVQQYRQKTGRLLGAA